MLVAQIGVALCLANVAISDPGDSIVRVALFSLGVAFFAATRTSQSMPGASNPRLPICRGQWLALTRWDTGSR
jgi:hypothetical protein